MRKRKYLAIFLTLAMVITILTLMAAPIFAADDDVVPDMNLRWKINNKLGVANPCAPISRAQMESLAGYLGANNPAVTSLEGLQYAKNLSELYLDSNNISNISPLSGMANLRLVDLSGNQISDLRPLSGLTKLTLLCIQCNQVSDLSPLSRMTNLTSLSLDDNQISDISPLSGLTNLTWLTLGKNQISDISPLSGLTNLKTLDLRYNQISDIRHLSGLTNLIHLRLGNNQISDISSLSGMTNMSSMLELNDNQISDISPLSELTNLRNLDLHCNQISDINPLSGITNLAWLCLGKNQISDLRPLSRITNKGSIYAKDQNISLSVGGAMVPNPLIAIDGTVVPITENANAINANNNQIKILSYDSMTDPVTVQFSDRRTKTYEFSGQLEISKGSETNAPAITTTNLTGGTIGTAYSETLAATGTPPVTWSVTSGSLPTGLTLDEATGVISGTPTTAGTATFIVKATNTAGDNTRELSIDIATVSSNIAPVASDVKVIGKPQVGETLTGSYIYSDLEGDTEGASIFKWYRSSNADGTELEEIIGAEGKTYKLTTQDKGTYIYFEVTPVAITGTLQGIAVMSAAMICLSGTEVSGIISHDTTWDKAGSPYIVTGNILVDTGIILTITEGVDVKFDGNYYIQIRGTLFAKGKESDLINFNSNNDDNWDAIQVNSNSNIFEWCIFQQSIYGLKMLNSYGNNLVFNCTFLNNGNGIYTDCSDEQAVTTISNCVFDNNSKGIDLDGGRATISECQIINSQYSGISVNWGAYDTVIDKCSLITNRTGVYIENFTGSILKITKSSIENNQYGIHKTSGGPTEVSNCNIKGNTQFGIVPLVDDLVHYNNFADNAYDFKSPSGITTIDASNNYWGTINIDEISNKITDFYDDFNLCRVIFEPYLLAPFDSNTDTTLKGIQINGTDLIGFVPATTLYNIELPYGITAIPEVTATANNSNATIVITPAISLPGSTEVMVMAEDGTTTKTYTINFTLATQDENPLASALTSLSIKEGSGDSGQELISNFDAKNLSYSVQVAQEIEFVKIVVTPATNTTTKIYLDDIELIDGIIPLTEGVNTVNIVVSETDKEDRIYVITIQQGIVDECFIATAAFGSKFTWPVILLRDFRDQYLLTNSWGKDFVYFYYNNSPPIAALIANSKPLKILIRVLLAPIIAIIYLLYHPTTMVITIGMGMLLLGFWFYRDVICKYSIQNSRTGDD